MAGEYLPTCRQRTTWSHRWSKQWSGWRAKAGGGSEIARAWIVRNARASPGARKADCSYGRFFDGPAVDAATNSLQTNGGYALAVAAATIAPGERVEPGGWEHARFVAAEANGFPARFAFTGSRIAAIGTIGEHCCEAGRARVLLDGAEPFDRRGVWQNKSNTELVMPGSVLFAWAWTKPGAHTIEFLPGEPNGKEGGPFIMWSGIWW